MTILLYYTTILLLYNTTSYSQDGGKKDGKKPKLEQFGRDGGFGGASVVERYGGASVVGRGGYGGASVIER